MLMDGFMFKGDEEEGDEDEDNDPDFHPDQVSALL